MSNIRKFYLSSASGELFALNGERGVWYTEPEGYGFELETEYLSLGDGFYAPLLDEDETEPQAQVAKVGTLTFDRPAYQNYRIFVDWVFAAGSLELVYVPFGEEAARAHVAIRSLQKGELDKVRLLHTPVELVPLSPWSRGADADLTLSAASAARYSGRYPGRYGQDAAGLMSARLPAAGHIPGAVSLRYSGGISDPEIRLTGARSGQVYGLCRLTAQIPVGAVLEYSSRKNDSYIRQLNADGSVTDLLQALTDPGVWPYARLPVDEDSILTVRSAAPFSGVATLSVYHYYRTV